MKKKFTTTALAALAGTFGVAVATDASAQHTTSWTGTVGEDRDAASGGRFRMRGRFQFDVMSNEWDTLAENGTRSYVRRAFLGVQGRFSEQWRYKVDFILAPGDDAAGQVGVDDAYLEYVNDDWSIVIGEHNITSPLEDRLSSLDIPFIERTSVINAFEYGRRAGIGFITGGANWSLSAAAQGDSLNNADTNFNLNESTAVSGRFTFAPIFETAPEGTTLLHFGIHARQRYSGDDALAQIRTRPLGGRGTRWIDAGSVVANRFEGDFSLGGEVSAQFGPFGVTAEYITLEGETNAGLEREYSGYYVDVFWSLTGESRAYRGNQGSFGAVVPRRPITQEGGWGHWMLSGRYDYVDLSDGTDPNRGEQTAYAIGLDWVPLDHVRFKLNYAISDMERTVGADDEAQIITLRTQFDF